MYHPKTRIALVAHGDDVVELDNDDDLAWYEYILEAAFELGECTRLGMGGGGAIMLGRYEVFIVSCGWMMRVSNGRPIPVIRNYGPNHWDWKLVAIPPRLRTSPRVRTSLNLTTTTTSRLAS